MVLSNHYPTFYCRSVFTDEKSNRSLNETPTLNLVKKHKKAAMGILFKYCVYDHPKPFWFIVYVCG